MKKCFYLVSAIILLPILCSQCSEAPNWDDEGNANPPGAVSNPIVKNINGGAVIFYTLPPDNETNLLGVKALYTRYDDGEILEAYSSSHTDSIVVFGFPDTKERKVTLIAFNSSKKESQPVEVTINPLIPPHELIRNSMEVSETFSGVLVKWDNPSRAEIGVMLFAEDSLGFMNLDYTYFTGESGHYAFRGFDDTERKFRVVIRDRWDNESTPFDVVLSPLFEEDVVARDPATGQTSWIRYGYTDQTTLWRGDYPGVYGSNAFYRMFDGIRTDAGYFHPGLAATYNLSFFTGNAEDAPILPKPFCVTIDMTRETKLSRYKFCCRNGTTTLNENDPYHLRIWASNETPKGPEDFNNDKMASLAYWTTWPQVGGTGAYQDDWTLVGECFVIPPSGALEGFQWTADDRIWYQAGVEFDFFSEHSNTPFRYLRIECIDNLKYTELTHFHEWEIYGSCRID